MPASHFLKIHFIIILPSTPWSSKWSLSLRFPYQNPIYICPLPHTCYMLLSFHSSWFDHPNYILWGVHIIKLLITYFSPLSCYLVSLRPKYSPILQIPPPGSLPQCERPSFTATQNNRQNYNSAGWCPIRDTSRQQLGWTLPDTVNTVKCSWWWAKISPETCRANLE